MKKNKGIKYKLNIFKSGFTGSGRQSENIEVTALAYPKVFAGTDTTICYDSDVQLQGFTDAENFYWTSSQNLTDAVSLHPSTRLTQSSQFILTAQDSRGCPRPVSDTVRVTVLPLVMAYAGNDTSVVINQPLQLRATGGSSFLWSPPDFLSKADIPDPVAIFPFAAEDHAYTVITKNQAGCADTASLTITVFNTLPSIFIPNAFTPNADGRNDQLHLITAGIASIEYFRVFNRWGKLIFTSGPVTTGWDGNFQGEPQPPGVYVWVVKANDYTGRPYFKKGVVTLLR